MYGLPLSQSDQRIRSVFQSVFNDEKYQFKLCPKYNRERDFDVIIWSVVPCRKLRWICRKRSNDVARQVEIPVSQQFCRATNLFSSHDITFIWRQRLHYIITVGHYDTAKDAFSV